MWQRRAAQRETSGPSTGNFMNVTVRTEDIMTPRNLLQLRSRDDYAEKLATTTGFDAIPISRSDGKILEFWSRTEKRRIRIRRAHRAAHDAPIESLLAALGDHIVQFVHYRSEVVGLIDASDLNKRLLESLGCIRCWNLSGRCSMRHVLLRSLNKTRRQRWASTQPLLGSARRVRSAMILKCRCSNTRSSPICSGRAGTCVSSTWMTQR
jgi:hypothetical protein